MALRCEETEKVARVAGVICRLNGAKADAGLLRNRAVTGRAAAMMCVGAD